MTTDEIDALLTPLRDVLTHADKAPELIILEQVHGGWSFSLEEDFDAIALSRGYWPTARAHELRISGVNA